MAHHTDGLYQLFGLTPDASREELRRAYRKRVALLHPDRNIEQDTTEQFKGIQNAYRTLLHQMDNQKAATKTDLSRQTNPATVATTASPTNSHPSSRDEVILNKSRLKQAYTGNKVPEPDQSPPTQEPTEVQAVRSTPLPRAPLPPRCQRCGIIHRSIRSRDITRITGLLLTTITDTHRAMLCAGCALKHSMIANLHNLILGWWSLGGALKMPATLLANAKGGQQIAPDNAVLLYRLANHELQINHNTVALELLDEAKSISDDQNLIQRIDRLLMRLGNPSLPGSRDNKPLLISTLAHCSLLLIPLLSVVIVLNYHWFLPQHQTPRPLGAGDPVVISPFHRTLYPDQRLGSHYSLGLVNLMQEADDNSRVLTRLPLFATVDVHRVDPDGWLEVSSGLHKGFVREAEIGFGDAGRARKANCDQYPKPRPFDGEILQGDTGEASLNIVNNNAQDALMQFFDGKTPVLSLYLHNNSQLNFSRLPAKASSVQVTHGQFYNSACHQFTRVTKSKRYRLTLLGNSQSISL
ncbi:J domain-containing protein [Aestuariirhabdus sp. Z084]|uniref:J domain-containing protein n=1 Tax=Aestuariirhabdus haliotis TaxID=2918751 RepID=UPI00201B4103|nr:J domain-containing protein [Aestuariirhabdus haliotis]MCL6414727.1 J domain-containing protein [Aestuariirhabdus haliotis]MCL6418659.1 J domain-containing protein [Aestuariirhabdus haliotis]